MSAAETQSKLFNTEPYPETAEEYFQGDDLATDVFLNKYALTDRQGNLHETHPAEMWKRLAKAGASVEEDQNKWEGLFYGIFKDFKAIPQGSILYALGNPFQKSSCSNCFVIPIQEDSLEGIFDCSKEMARTYSYRGGCGTDLDILRPSESVVSNSARHSTGAWSFADFYSYVTRLIGQHGRRGALMISMSDIHPDIAKFIVMKQDKKLVTGANVSVKIHDAFMKAVQNNEDWTMYFETKHEQITKVQPARELWDLIINCATNSAEPGVLFWDTILRESPSDCYADVGFRTLTTNPCVIGSSVVATADGRNGVSIKQLSEENSDVLVYSRNPKTGQVEIKKASHFRKTGVQKKVYKLTLDDGSYLVATPDHKIMLKDGTYTELQNLQEGDSLSPFNAFVSNNRYRQIAETGKEMMGGRRRNRRQYRLIHEYHNGVVDAKEYAIHHVDCDSFNDSIQNLKSMSHEEHREVHNIRGDNNPIRKLQITGKYEEWKANNPFFNNRGVNNTRYIDISNSQLIEEGRKCIQERGSLTKRIWIDYAKQNHLPQYLGNEFRFGSFSKFKSCVISNHKVQSVEYYGVEDVYDCYVEDNHNFAVLTSTQDDRYIASSGIFIHNCSEIPLPEYDACTLLAMCVWKYVVNPFTKHAYFDWTSFRNDTEIATRFLDNVKEIDLELMPLEKQRETARKGRRIGMGITGLADCLAMLGLKYDSLEGVEFSTNLQCQYAKAVYGASIDLAKEKGPFPVFDAEKEKNNPFLTRLGVAGIPRRNIACLTIAPTGSISCLAQSSSGLEPVFKNMYYRWRKVQKKDYDQLAVDMRRIDDLGDHWQKYKVCHHNIERYAKTIGVELVDIIDGRVPLPDYFTESDQINWEKRVEIQAGLQKWVDHSISSTCNLPRGTSTELVSKIYMRAWELGCKGFTVYVDGCRDGVLTLENEEKDATTAEKMLNTRPKTLEADVYHITVKGTAYFIFVGLMDGKPYEVFAGKNGFIPKGVKRAELTKVKRGIYKALLDNDDEIANINGHVTDDEAAVTRLISLSLRSGADIQFIVAAVEKTPGELSNFSKSVARALKKYIPDGTKEMGMSCPGCEAEDTLIREEGCIRCVSCGYSRCS